MYEVYETDYDDLKTSIRDLIVTNSKTMDPSVLASEILTKMDDVIIRGMIP